jgi:hypothetical protein
MTRETALNLLSVTQIFTLELDTEMIEAKFEWQGEMKTAFEVVFD